MSDAFARAYRFVRKWEGGKSAPRPGDPFPTNYGITQAFYDGLPGFPAKSVYDLTEPEAEAVYRWLWTDARADRLPDLVAVAFFDAAVNLGKNQATKQLQRAVSVTPDGSLGPATLAAVAAASAKETVVRMLGQRIRFYRQLAERNPDKARWLNGWLNRTTDLQRELGL